MSKTQKHTKTFMALYEPVERQISNYCRALAGNHALACDLLQDTLLAALEGFDRIRQPESFLFFLCGIAKRTYLKQQRRNKFESDIETVNLSLFVVQPQETADVEILYKAMATLPVDQREAITMFEIMGFSLKEIQDFQGGSLSGVKSRIVRARQKLTEMLTEPLNNKVVVQTGKNVML